MIQKGKSSVIDLLFTLALFCVFCASALAVVLIGADVYTSTVRSMDRNYSTRTACAYLAEKARQSDRAGAISLGEVEQTPALVLDTTGADGASYTTYIYYYDGTVCEQLIRAEDTPVLANGQRIIECGDLTIEPLSDTLWQVTVTGPQGGSEQVIFGQRSREGGAV